MKTLKIAMVLLVLSACTAVRYSDGDKHLTVIDFHPAGEALNIDAVLTNVGKLKVNRNTSDSSEVIRDVTATAAGAAIGLPL